MEYLKFVLGIHVVYGDGEIPDAVEEMLADVWRDLQKVLLHLPSFRPNFF